MSKFQQVKNLIELKSTLLKAEIPDWTWDCGYVCKREFSVDERKKAAKEGAALPDGSFPIYNATDLKHAESLVGMSNHSESTVLAHIHKRAKQLGLEHHLKDGKK